MTIEQTKSKGHPNFWRLAFFSAATASAGSLLLALYLDEHMRPLWRIHKQIVRPYWIGAGVCGLVLLVCSIAIRRYDTRLCRIGIYSLLALLILVPIAIQVIRGGVVY